MSQGRTALVSPEDFHRVAAFKWSATRTHVGKWYANRRIVRPDGSQTTVLLHRFITGAPKGMDVDHENGDGLDCRRENMRVCTRQQNRWNTGKLRNGASSFKGVTQHASRRRPWRASIMIDGKSLHLGTFFSEVEAAVAYDEAAKRLHGEFVKLNFA